MPVSCPEINGSEGGNIGLSYDVAVTLRKRLRIRSVISVNYHYITVLCPFNLLIRF